MKLQCLSRTVVGKKRTRQSRKVIWDMISKISMNIPLTDSVTYDYVVSTSDQSWHQICVHSGLIYGLRVSPESDGMKFAFFMQTLQDLQGTRNMGNNYWAMPHEAPRAPTGLNWGIPPEATPIGLNWGRPNWGMPPEAPPTGPNWGMSPEATPTGPTIPSPAPVGMARAQDPPSQDGESAQRRQDYDSQIDALCLTLSDAIRNGKQDKAADLTKQMSIQKLPLSIKLKNPVFVTMDSGVDTINIRVVVEDKESSGGVFSMKALPTTTIKRLQHEVFNRYGFPVQVQKWIVGKKIPRPQDTLQDLNVGQSGHTVFLYLLSGKTVGLRRSDAESFQRINTAPASLSAMISACGNSVAVTTPAAPNTAAQTQMRRTTSVPSLFAQQHGGQGQGDVANPPDPPPQEAFVNNILAMVPQTDEDGHPVGRTCSVYTYINQPTRPGCEMCSADRPPDGTVLDERERNRIAAEERSEQPVDKDDFLETVKRQYVCLERVECEQTIVRGFVRVLNIAYKKEVCVRYTMDGWKTFRQEYADYLSTSRDGNTDTFFFQIPAPTICTCKVEFAICYLVEGNEYWDNNVLNNYSVGLVSEE